jgi:hypothetical protein
MLLLGVLISYYGDRIDGDEMPENLNGRSHLEDTGVDGRIILKLMLKK